jgi:membrane-associated protease RseP (regulator of RpoE activity)
VFKRFVFFVFLCLPWQGALAAAPVSSAAGRSLLALQDMDRRVAVIGHRLARANLDICPRTMPLSGMLVHVLDQYSGNARPVAAATFGLADDPALLVVVPDGAAAAAGLRAGDTLLAVGGQTFPAAGSRRKGNYGRVQQVEEVLLAGLAKGPLQIDYRRDGAAHTATLGQELGCLSRVQLVPSTRLNASADGTYVQVTSRIVEFTRSDDELALVIAHEMAHNILGHRMELDRQKVSRGILKTFDGSAGKIKVTEVEADHLALYLVARAGFALDAAPAFWDRYGRKAGLGIFSDGTHPGRSSRVAAAEKTIAEIRLKQAQGLPLVPNAALD